MCIRDSELMKIMDCTESTDIQNCNDLPVAVEFSVPFRTADLAHVAYNSLRVDKEPKRSLTTKKLVLEDNILKVYFTSENTRQLRTALNSFLDLLILVSKTLEEFASADFKI